MKKLLFLILGVIVAFLGGCSLAPEYRRPAAPVPADWPTGAEYSRHILRDLRADSGAFRSRNRGQGAGLPAWPLFF